MAYNNYNNGYNRYGSNNYNNGYSRNYNRGNYSANNYSRQPRKKSGAKSGTDKNGKPYVRGWRASRRFGLVSYFASPYHATSEVKSKSGRVWETWILKVQPQNAAPFVQPCLYDVASRKVVCQALGIVINPNANNGGFAGKFGTKR